MGADLASAEEFPDLYEKLAKRPMAASLMLQLERCNLRSRAFKQGPASDCDALG